MTRNFSSWNTGRASNGRDTGLTRVIRLAVYCAEASGVPGPGERGGITHRSYQEGVPRLGANRRPQLCDLNKKPNLIDIVNMMEETSVPMVNPELRLRTTQEWSPFYSSVLPQRQLTCHVDVREFSHITRHIHVRYTVRINSGASTELTMFWYGELEAWSTRRIYGWPA